MNIHHLNYSDLSGGAARAAYRIHHALLKHGLRSRLCVDHANSNEPSVCGPLGTWRKTLAALRPRVGALATGILRTGNPVLHSPAILPSRWPDRINSGDADVVHLHWICGEMLSIPDLARIRKPIVWTLHDMWAFCGAEHYTEDCRWREGYRRGNRPPHESGFDLNRWTWRRKRTHWRRPLHIATPSRWLADCVRESALMHGWPVTVVPNPIDIDRWRPLDQAMARSLLGLPADTPLVLFGSMDGGRDPRKGFDLLLDALAHLHEKMEKLHLVVFGQPAPDRPPEPGFPVHYIGHLHDDISLCLLYNAADVLVIPSRQDNLPNTGVESLACGTPVVAFDTCGLPDIVEHKRTGYLARAFDTEDLAEGISWVLVDRERHRMLRTHARAAAVSRFSEKVIIPRYIDWYKQAQEEQGRHGAA
ncbi:glycosyltransferase [Dissulfurirhabdus thermomarina]|uniref:Glycosyltransferase n=1 Tax=Dissulfurirhabdus thermomarina TaxID=1765737 RepID=A0A6N9TQC5_DISTH|nr:glycosyltransferase family 4 protein [Dissulfurirhabdus thermomarina]NDY42303.1 glycosyltransferase [Dissulfurirhabdus thermomarina]NMX24162.1 glycosyltransferase [Dissulfurirhabdus thermomarina]